MAKNRNPKEIPSGKVTVDTVNRINSKELDEFFDDIVRVEKESWPPELQASKEKFVSRLQTFGKGFFVARVDGRIKGITTSQIVSYPSEGKTWNEITDNGFIKKTHNPSGNALYVVSIGVARDVQGMGLGSLLLGAQKEITKELGLSYLFLGARIPRYDGYCREHGEISVEEYLKLKNDKNEPFDPEIRFYMRNGLEPKKIITHFEPDRESRDYGAVMVWENKS
ncbi:MAG: hypothetical protein ACD_50C00333G0008 [uncultured bacterium]|nr:MAG: hypothetical protein ACD_50C00333G0008 [uncultured bacterium]OGH13811.1 MAG: hypothetical protein A2687_03425 [Candidatus Levybacteria bacterium RIFCSPHIGHO2_01_FULL_38_26]